MVFNETLTLNLVNKLELRIIQQSGLLKKKLLGDLDLFATKNYRFNIYIGCLMEHITVLAQEIFRLNEYDWYKLGCDFLRQMEV